MDLFSPNLQGRICKGAFANKHKFVIMFEKGRRKFKNTELSSRLEQGCVCEFAERSERGRTKFLRASAQGQRYYLVLPYVREYRKDWYDMGKEERNTYTIKTDENLGEVKIADEVVSIIAGLAAMEVEGVSSMAGNATRELVAKLGMKSLSKGVKVDVLEGIVTVSLALNLKYGYGIREITAKVQEKVKAAIENMTGLEVADVNIRVAGVDVPEEA